MDNINLIRRIAWSFSTSTKEEFDDLFQEAALAYHIALKDYKPSRGVKLSTYMWYCIDSHLKNYLAKQGKHFDPLMPIDDVTLQPAYILDPFMENLSVEAKRIAELILKTPNQFTPRTEDDCIARIKKILTNHGWNRVQICRGLKDLKLACN